MPDAAGIGWLNSILENKAPLPSIGSTVHARGNITGEVVGWIKEDRDSTMNALVLDVVSGATVTVQACDIIVEVRASGANVPMFQVIQGGVT